MSSLVEIPLPKKRENDAAYAKAFEEFKAVVVPFLQCATFKRAFPLICAAVASSCTPEQLRARMEELRRRINRYLRDKINVGKYAKSIYLKSDENEREITCLHWNCCGIVGQTVRTKETSLLDLIVAFEPDIILLNEVKAKEEDIQAVVRGLDASYACFGIPSTAPKGRSMRGSVIIYRFAHKFKLLPVAEETWGEAGEAPVIEAVAVDVQTSLGKRYRLINSYVRGSDEHFDEAENIFSKLSNGPTVIAGDLNMRKEKFVRKWKEAGFGDALNPAWHTNKSRQTLTSIDYVMHNGKEGAAPLVCHKPIQPDNDAVHFPILFTLGAASSGPGFCTDAACMFGCCGK